ncbi:MAG TPA: hypothetical protein EYQ74_08735 [Planctomycetes bacterium]|nr:hypothetical protein [Planctomycetota bacterium]HIK60862.1 hypothetical protein [Planctomycetota bacterium]
MSVTHQTRSAPAGGSPLLGEAGASHVSSVPMLIEDASELMRAGRWGRALESYRQVLELDPARADVAQRIAWMEREQRELRRVRDSRLTFALTAFMLALVGSWVIVREAQLNELVAGLPAVRSDAPASVSARLAAMDSLLSDNPIWIGGLTLRRKREQLHAREVAGAASRSRREEALRSERELQVLVAQAACTRGRLLLEDGLMAEARFEFAQALKAVPVSSDLGVRIQAELDAIDEYLLSAPDHTSPFFHSPNLYPAGGR